MAITSPGDATVSNLVCNRCGGTISAKVTSYETFYVYCGSCNALISQEALSFKKKYEAVSKENAELKMKQEGIDITISKMKNRAEAVEKAYSDESREHLEVRAQRDWARNAIMYWRSFLDHFKVKATCPFCAMNQPCQTIKLIEEQALSATPEWDCETCKKKDADCAVLKSAVAAWNDVHRHYRNCHRCSERLEVASVNCSEFKDLQRTMQHQMSVSENQESGATLLSKMVNIIKDFSYLGEGSAIMYDGGVYHVIKMNIRKIKSGEVTYLSVGSNPRIALDKAKETQTLETMQHAG